jgi:hypothetical protein
LGASRIEHETVPLALYLDGHKNAVMLELYVDGIGKITLGQSEAQRIAVHVLRSYATE